MTTDHSDTTYRPEVSDDLPQYTWIAKADLESGGWVIVYPDLPGCMTQADSYAEAAEMAEDALRAWLAVQRHDGKPIPPPSDYPLPEWDMSDPGPDEDLPVISVRHTGL